MLLYHQKRYIIENYDKVFYKNHNCNNSIMYNK